MHTSENGKIQTSAMTIAGSDSGGNAGIQADIRAFHVYGLHACTVIAALTAQNPYGVRSVVIPDQKFIADQMDSVFEEYTISALKTGMLANSSVIEVVAGKLAEQVGVLKVVDPVMVATSGAKLLADNAIEDMIGKMLPVATLITPNLPETSVIVEKEVSSKSQMESAAKEIYDKHGCAVLVKGGHNLKSMAEDVLYDGKELTWYSLPSIQNPLSTHGTGCSLSAAITALLARGNDLKTSVEKGKQYVWESIRSSIFVGKRATVLGTPGIS
ncbi:MAG: bifunctional hydroxymethylpyrimidine kinase/phosphomethylpyrimidine kinase [Lentisphaerae bacterium]|jgi:hydroxymethylpyrimidine/phosphomethylpyrimidine kinase|nr:bifunctional hydroxymethylpyrimidine kinase/phosphomethylpyrimidine kinase [Lentisphaerota bacterium]